MSWVDDVVRVVLDLVDRPGVGGQPLEDRLAAAEQVSSNLPAEPAHVRLYIDALISAAKFTARGILPVARNRLSWAVPLIEISPHLGYLVFKVAAADSDRTGEAHDLLVRLVEAELSATHPQLSLHTALSRYDVAAAASLAGALTLTGDMTDSLGRIWVLLSVGKQDAAAEMLMYLFQHTPEDVRKTLAATRGLVEKCVLGRPDVAGRLLDSVVPRLQPHSSISSAALHSLVMLVDACTDEGRARALVQQVVPEATEKDFYSWGAAASQNEFQRAAATFACAGLAATGSHLSAELAVFRLAASDGARRAIEIALATDWEPDYPRLDLLFSRCIQVADDDDQLNQLARGRRSSG